MRSASLSTAKNVFEAVAAIISPKVSWDVKTENPTNKCLTIKEEASDSKIQRLELQGFDGPIFAFKMDSGSSISPLFNAKAKDIQKGCDALIFTQLNNTNYIFICELKSGRPQGFTSQFKSSEAFIDYMDALLNRFSNYSLKDFKRVQILFTTENKDTVYSKNNKLRPVEKDGIKYLSDTNCSRNTYRNIQAYIK